MRYFVDELTAKVSGNLSAALGLPDLVDPEATCSLMLRDPIFVMLEESTTRAIQVRLPQDTCGNPRPEVVDALQGAAYRTVGSYSVLVDDVGRK